MKHKFLLFFLLLSAAVLPAQELSLMVVSDMHVLDNSLWNQDTPEIFYSDPKMVEHSAELFDMAVERILESRPDILLVPGDLTYNGELKSHQYVAEQLARIKANGTQVFVIPGNHDISDPGAKDFTSGKGVRTDNLSAAGFAELYAAFGYGNAVMRLDNETDSLSYMAYPEDGVAVIGLNTCLSNIGGHKSAGCITEGTLKFLQDCSAKALAEGHRNILLMAHHPMMEHIDKQSAIDASHIANMAEGMIPLSEIQERLTGAHIHAVFTGHAHLNTISRVPTANGDLYDISTGSLCSFPSPMRHGILNIETGNLILTGEEITKYQQEGYGRDTVLAKAAVNSIVDIIHPKMQSFIQKLKEKPLTQKAFEEKLGINVSQLAGVSKEDLKEIVWEGLGQEIHHAFTSLSRGDEDAGVFFDTDSAYNAAVKKCYNLISLVSGLSEDGIKKALTDVKVQAALALMNISIDSSILPEAILGSIYYNYVTVEEEQLVTPDASCVTQRSINVREGTVNAVEDIHTEPRQSGKRLENGQIVIYHNGVRMNILGQSLR